MKPLFSQVSSCLGLAAMLAIGANPVFGFQQPAEGDLDFNTKNEREVQTEADQTRELVAKGPTGEFTSLHQGKVLIRDDSGEIKTFETTEQTEVMVNGKKSTLQKLQKGDRVQIVMGPGQTAVRLMATRGETTSELQTPPSQNNPRQTESKLPPNSESLLRQPDVIRSNQGNEGTPQQERTAQQQERTPQQREARFRPRQTDEANQENDLSKQTSESTAWMGLMLRDAEDQKGLEIVRTYPSGPAARAGLRSGDTLLKVGGKMVTSPEDVSAALQGKKPRDQVEVIIMRDQQEAKANVYLADRYDFLEDRRQMQREREQREQQDRSSDRVGDNNFDNHDVPEHSMMLEQHRRLAEQHQRLEEKLDKVLEELQALKKQMGQQPNARINR